MALGAQEIPYPVWEIGYAEDLVSMASSRAGLQRRADVISAFTQLFGMEISIGILRLGLFGPPPAAAVPPDASITLYGPS